ncbi:NUDIX domain-containing protein [Thermolongibacillus altinsuensis]|uniref:NUDIX domain-containing protein n=2 Tax=Thermolongibacillus altinsuensis TaxID=575256 RepID=A0A4R1QEZ2_9BACL|nr:NUDIX domain-containing protein [Thermolongibacillus altinsuensis]TCL49661.1 NUDIX domain-containing protein [Thermolongibacillus altinsuensis]
MVLVRRVKAKANTYMQLIPPGGHIENCETLEEAARRELYEETGIVAEQLNLVGVISFITYPKKDHAICFVYFSYSNQGEIEAKEKEKEKVIPEWVEVKGFEENEDIPHYYRQFLKAAMENKQFINCIVEWDENKEGLVTFK